MMHRFRSPVCLLLGHAYRFEAPAGVYDQLRCKTCGHWTIREAA